MTTTAEALQIASEHLRHLPGHVFEIVNIAKPVSPTAAVNFSKIVSKLSSLVGNLIELNIVEYLNAKPELQQLGTWKRQDPGFPDTIFVGSISPTPGIEVKAWLPLATEITARFRDSQGHFTANNTNVCILAWLPEHLLYGRPKIIDACMVSGRSIAEARDNHYHNPPDYIVIEPEDTSGRTSNLQQTNTQGHKWQGTDPAKLDEARALVASWGPAGRVYQTSLEYQRQLRELRSRFDYRLDTNFAKMNRIVHPEVLAFKSRVMALQSSGLAIRAWSRMLRNRNDAPLREALRTHLGIIEGDAERILR